MFNDDLLPAKKPLSINITSLIDVLFLLLIFFMVTSTFVKNSALKVALPDVKGEESVVKNMKTIDIVISKNEKIQVNGEEVSFKELEKHINKLRSEAENKQPAVHFSVDKGLSYGFVMKVMSKLKESGIKTIMAITEE